MTGPPLVSIGLPVRDGEATLARTLDGLLAQTHEHLEIIVSDNCSSDRTAEIAADYARRFAKVRTVRQPFPLSALENFRAVLAESRGEYFMWAADDDHRNPDYVAKLLARLRDDAAAILCFGDFAVSAGEAADSRAVALDFENAGRGLAARLARSAFQPCYHLYGVWRAADLKKIDFLDCWYWPDMQIILAAACMGDFVRARGATFTYFDAGKSLRESEERQTGRAGASWLFPLQVITSSFHTVRRARGFAEAMTAAAFLCLREIRNIAWYLMPRGGRAAMRRLIGRTSARTWRTLS